MQPLLQIVMLFHNKQIDVLVYYRRCIIGILRLPSAAPCSDSGSVGREVLLTISFPISHFPSFVFHFVGWILFIIYRQDFQGNADRNSVITQILFEGLVTRYVRVIPKNWRGLSCLRVELYGASGTCHQTHYSECLIDIVWSSYYELLSLLVHYYYNYYNYYL